MLSTISSSRLRRAAVVVVAVFLVGELFFLTYTAIAGSGKASVNSDKVALIASQLRNNQNSLIADIGYDSALNVEKLGPYFKPETVNPNSLSPLSNNFLARVNIGEESRMVLIDETAVARVIALNSHWVSYLNNDGNAVLSDIQKGSRAEEVINSYKGYKIVFHRLAIGEIYSSGSTIYLLAQPYYTILKDGRTATVNTVFVYKLVRQGDTLVVSDIDTLKLPTESG